MKQQLEDKVREVYKRKEKLIWYIKLARYGYIANLKDNDLSYDIIINLDIGTDLHILEEYFIKIWKKMPMIKNTENNTIDEILIKCFRLNWT